MLFHIFGSNSSDFNCKLKDDLASDPKDYNKTLEEYSELVSNGKYTDLYFIVDLCSYKMRLIEKIKYISVSDCNDRLPFIILSEHHLDDSDGKSVVFRNDLISIRSSGFVHEFQDNKAAIERFLYCVDNRIPCKLELMNSKSSIPISDTRSALLSKWKINKFSMCRV